MPLSRAEERELAEKRVLSPEQLAEARVVLEQMGSTTVLTMQNVLIFFGGLIGIGAISIWYTLTKNLTGWEIMFLACGLGVAAIVLTHYLLARAQDSAASVTATFAVFTATLATFGYQMATGSLPELATMTGYHQTIKPQWLSMEVATIVTGVILLWVYRLPFITMPIALSLWYMSMDLAPMLAEYWVTPQEIEVEGRRHLYYEDLWRFKLWVSVVFGFLTMVVAFVIDITTKGQRDFAFWPYLAGLAAFWFGLTLMGEGTELTKAIYAAINVVLVFMGPFLMRRAFIVAGGVGVSMYLGEQALKRFVQSADFFVTLLAIAGVLIVLGITWGRYATRIEKRLSWIVPQKLRDRWSPVA